MLFPVGVRSATGLDQGGELHDEARTSLQTQIRVFFQTETKKKKKLYNEKNQKGKKEEEEKEGGNQGRRSLYGGWRTERRGEKSDMAQIVTSGCNERHGPDKWGRHRHQRRRITAWLTGAPDAMQTQRRSIRPIPTVLLPDRAGDRASVEPTCTRSSV